MKTVLLALTGTCLEDFQWFRRAVGGRWERWYLDVVHVERWFRVDGSGARPCPIARGTPKVEEYDPVTDARIPLPRPHLFDVARAALATFFFRVEKRSEWQWYRRVLGGRWSRREDGSWARVASCPGPARGASLRPEDPVPCGLCYEFSIDVVGADGAVVARAVVRECHCELWR